MELYGNPVSQPSRAVEWVLRLKQAEYKLVKMDFGSSAFTSADFLAMNPNGQIPVLKDGNFTLTEGNAIMVYLAEKLGWTDLYPTDVQTHAKVNQYLNWHHTNARHITSKVLVPLMHTKMNVGTPEEAVLIKDSTNLLAKLSDLMEKLLTSEFIAGTDHPTVADVAAYCEFHQVELMGIFDFAKYPKLSAWLGRMKKVPHHDDMHADVDAFLSSLGLKTKASA